MIQTNQNDSVVIKAPIYDEITGKLITEEAPIHNQGIRGLVTENNEPTVQAVIQQQSTRGIVNEADELVVIKGPIYDEITGKLITEEAPIQNQGTKGLVSEDNNLAVQAAIQQQSTRGLVTESDELVVIKGPIYDEITGDLLTQEG